MGAGIKTLGGFDVEFGWHHHHHQPDDGARSFQAIEASGRFCVNVLTEKDNDVCAWFGSKEPDTFAGSH